MDRGGDVFGTLAWGLRRYAWVVVLATVLVGVLVPYALSQSEDAYEAEATVAATAEVQIPSLDALPKTVENIFSDGAVAQVVRTRYNLSDTTPVVPDLVEVVADQDSLAFAVIGRDRDPAVAADLADTAAKEFVLELNAADNAVGTFGLVQEAAVPVTPEPKLAGGPLTIAIGILAGLLLGVALVVLLLVLRRPVLDAESARDATGAPVLGRVTLPRGRGEVNERDTHGLGSLCRRLLASGSPVILLVSPRSAVSVRHRLSTVMAKLLGRSRNVFVSQGGEHDLPTLWELVTRRGGRKARVPDADRTELVLVDGPTVEERTSRPDTAMTLLVVPEGIGLGALRLLADEYLDGDPGGVVLVRTRRAGSFRREPRQHVDETPSTGLHSRDDDDPPTFFDDDDQGEERAGHYPVEPSHQR